MSSARRVTEGARDIDPLDSCFKCITTCSWLGGEDIECVTRCIEIYLKKEL